MNPEQHEHPQAPEPLVPAQAEIAEPVEAQPADSVNKKQRINTPAAILTGAVIIAIAVFFALHKPAAQVAQQAANKPQIPTSVDPKVLTIRPDDYVRGNKNADIAVFEYSDSDCPFCAKFHPTMQQLIKDSNGTVAWVYRLFPLTIHPNAYTEALALNCVGTVGGNDAFWTYLDKVMDVTLNPTPESNKTLITIAQAQGINADRMNTCLKDTASTKKIDADTAEAGTIGARGTPFSIAVNLKTGKQVVIPGAYPLDYVKQAIESIK